MGAPESIYLLKCGTADTLLRERQTDNLGKLGEMMTKYMGRPEMTSIRVERADVLGVSPKGIHCEPPVLMIEAYRKDGESPWVDIPLVGGGRA